TRNSLPCPTADAACSSSIARGRRARPITSIPRAIAPEVTITTCRPARCSSAVSAHRRCSVSRRTAPVSSATMLEPSFTTATLTWRRLWADRGSAGEGGEREWNRHEDGREGDEEVGELLDGHGSHAKSAVAPRTCG